MPGQELVIHPVEPAENYPEDGDWEHDQGRNVGGQQGGEALLWTSRAGRSRAELVRLQHLKHRSAEGFEECYVEEARRCGEEYAAEYSSLRACQARSRFAHL